MIDAAIPLAGRAPEVTSPLTLLTQAGNIQGQQQEQQLRSQAIQQNTLSLNKAGQDAQDEADVRAAMAAAVDPATGQADRKVLLSTLGRLNPTKAAQMATTLNAQDIATGEAKAKLQKAQLDAATAHVDAKDKLLQGVTDQATYTNALNQGYALGIVKPGELPTTYDPALVAQLHQQTLSQKEVLAQKNAEATQAETARKDTATEDLTKATLANTQANQAAERKQEAQRIGIAAGELRLHEMQSGIGADGSVNPLAQAIAQGHITPDRMGYLLARNPALLQGVLAVDPSFDSSKAQSYPATYKDFTSGKTATALNAGGTALQHLKELRDLNTAASHIPGTAAYNAYQNKADTVAAELARFYGTDTVSGIGSIKSTLTATLPYQRDAAITTQAKSMGDKLDSFEQTWQNAAPSKVYQAPMPGLSPKAKEARAALDPDYKPQGATDFFSQFGGAAKK